MPDRPLPTDVAQLTAVIVDRLTRLQTDVSEMRAEMRAEIKALPTSQEVSTLRQRVDAMEAWQNWALRAVVGAVLLAILAVVVTKGGTS